MSRGATQPVLAGVVAALVGFASTFALVLAGLRAVGADPQEAASGLVALCVLMGAAAIWLGLRTRLPITTAWGAGLVAAAAAVAPPLLVEAVAGLALIGALGAALAGALGADEQREAAIITFVVSASAVTVLGISAPFWGLLAGLASLGVQRAGAVPGRAAREPV